jgi:1,4-alpha-glucan branching enzyme
MNRSTDHGVAPRATGDVLAVVCNFTPVTRHNERIGVPRGGYWAEVLNSDSREYGGSGQGNLGGLEVSPIPSRGRPYSLNLTLPPLAVVWFNSQSQDL